MSMDGLRKMYRRAVISAADLLFPLACVGCGMESEIVCGDCIARVSFAPVCACPRCGKQSSEGRSCHLCAKSVGVDGVIGSFDYHDPLISQLIKAWKYHGMGAAGAQIERLLGELVAREPWIRAWASHAALVPVPLHRRRLCERGFNQAALLARAWAGLLNLPVVECLDRIVYTQAQAKKTGAARQKLSAGVFAMKRGAVLETSKIILIDDVYTTGATFNSAVRILRAEGVKEVYGLVYARET